MHPGLERLIRCSKDPGNPTKHITIKNMRKNRELLDENPYFCYYGIRELFERRIIRSQFLCYVSFGLRIIRVSAMK